MTGFRLTVLAAAMLAATAAQAQPHREHERDRYRTPHWVYDDRFHHNHYYPAIGYSVAALPGGHLTIGFRGSRFFFHGGVWYQAGGPGYVIVRPPLGVVVPLLPPSYTMVWVAGVPYYYANDIYYAQAPGGYVVAQPPMGAAPVQEPPPAPPAQPAQPPAAPGTWHYCESARAYYPYVTECREGWRAVPATPPQPR
jgi:hypothetical protein